MIEIIKVFAGLLYVVTTIVGAVTIMRWCAAAISATDDSLGNADLEVQLAHVLKEEAPKILRDLQPAIIHHSREQLIEFGRLFLVFGLVDAGVEVLSAVPDHLARARDRADMSDEQVREVFDGLFRTLCDVLNAARPGGT